MGPSRAPWPSGPPECGQMPSIACSTPARLHTATASPSPTSKCVAEPGGSNFSEPTLTKAMFSFLYHGGRDDPPLGRGLHFQERRGVELHPARPGHFGGAD